MRPALAIAVALAGGAGTPGHAAAKEVRVAVIAGANLGSAGDEPLRFAESDARRVREVLVDLGGVDRSRARLVLGGGPDQLRQALARAGNRIAALRAAGHRVVFFFYFSGHGDHGALHLPAGRLSLAGLRAAITAIPADIKVSIVDACRTAPSKGVRPAGAFPVMLAPGPAGQVELWSAAPGEVAQESGEVAASIFSHFLTAGLRGDADIDGDRQVTFAEIYSYVYRKTLARTATGTALQHPELRAEVAGAGELVVSRPGRAKASLVYAGTGQLLIFRLPSGTPVGELSRGARLALPPGRFLVVRRAGGARGVAQIDLSWGGTRVLAAADFRPISREELAARGGRLELRTHRVEAALGGHHLPGAEETVLAAGLGWASVHGRLVVGLAARFIGGSVATSSHEGRTLGGSLRGRLGVRTFLERGTLEGFLAAELRAARQRTRRRDGTPETERDQFQGGVGSQAGFRVGLDLGAHTSLFAEVALGIVIQRQLDRAEDRGRVVEAAGELAVGVGYAF